MISRLKMALGDILGPPSLLDVVQRELETAQAELGQTQNVIRSHRFQEHMVRAKIEALNAWYQAEEKNKCG